MSMTCAALGGEDVTDQNWLCVTTPLRTLIMSVFSQQRHHICERYSCRVICAAR